MNGCGYRLGNEDRPTPDLAGVEVSQRVLRGIECDILPDGRLDLPDDVLAELEWVQASVHGGQRMPRPSSSAIAAVRLSR